MKGRLKKADTSGINKILSEISNNPTISTDALIRKARELGYEPMDLIDAALGSVKYEKSKANLSSPLDEVLNDIFEQDPTPGRRYVIDPTEAISKRGKEVAKSLEGNLGVATSVNFGKSRALPDFVAVRPAYDDLEKLKAIAHAGHELEHQKDFFVRPDYQMKTEKSYKPGHHFKDIYEPSELIREARELPEDEKLIQEVLKQSKKSYVKPSPFTRLRGILAPLAAAAGLYSAGKSGDALGATLEGAALIDPTGISDAAAEINRRLKMSPEEVEEVAKEDKYSAIPGGPSPSDIMIDQLNESDELEIEKEIKKRKQKLGYE